MSGVETESLTKVLQIGVIVSECCLRHGRRRSGVSPDSKCRVQLMMVAVLGVPCSRILKPVGAKLSSVNMGTIKNVSGCHSICLMTILWVV